MAHFGETPETEPQEKKDVIPVEAEVVDKNAAGSQKEAEVDNKRALLDVEVGLMSLAGAETQVWDGRGKTAPDKFYKGTRVQIDEYHRQVNILKNAVPRLEQAGYAVVVTSKFDKTPWNNRGTQYFGYVEVDAVRPDSPPLHFRQDFTDHWGKNYSPDVPETYRNHSMDHLEEEIEAALSNERRAA